MKYSLLIPVIYLASCMNTTKEEVKPVYDEAALRAFVLGTPIMMQNSAVDSLSHILVNASKDSAVFRKTITFLSEPFGSPNSSYRNQPLYATLLQAKMYSNWYIAEEKEIAKRKLILSQQNNIGSVANDFPYTTPAGEQKHMHELNAKFLLLYFNNPECEACKEMKAALTQSAVINEKIKTGELKVLSVYAEADTTNWRIHLKEYPAQWLQGIGNDSMLYKSNRYDLTAIPTLYLLDKEKRILLKDYFSVQEIEQFIR